MKAKILRLDERLIEDEQNITKYDVVEYDYLTC